MSWGIFVANEKKIVIIGGCAGGGTSAQFARKTDRTASITVFEKGKYPQYSKCGLPYVIAGIIPDFNNLIEFSQEWFQKEHIDLLLETTVETINLQQKIVTATRGEETIEKEFDSLILATGGKPWIPPIQNIQRNGELLKGAHVLRTIDDGKQIASLLKKGKKATIIGAGLIGLEMADCLQKNGMKVTIVEALPTILANTIDEDMSELILPVLQENNITLFINHRAMKVDEQNGCVKSLTIKNVATNEETSIITDILIIATGTKPDVTLAKSIGCSLGKTGGIIVNERAETSIKNVYAVGDCTEYRDFITQEPLCVGLGSIVVRQGIAAGINAAGGTYQLPRGVLLSRTSEFFGVEIAAVGPIKNTIGNLPVIIGKYKGCSLPEYYPGGKPITIKIGVHEETGQILFAQAIGSNAAQRMNVFACALLNKTSVEELKKLETTYAPPIAPTLDALTLACDVVALKMARKRR